MAWAPACTFPRFAHWCTDLSIMLKNIYEKTLNFQYIYLRISRLGGIAPIIGSVCYIYINYMTHVVASAGTGGRLGPVAIHASRPAGMHKIQSLLTYVKHVQSPRFFQDTLYIFSSQQYYKCKQMSQNQMSLQGGCPGTKSALLSHWQGPKSPRHQAFDIQLRALPNKWHIR